MNMNEFNNIREQAHNFAQCFKRGNNCRKVSRKEEEFVIECLQYKLSKTRCKHHKYVVGVKPFNYGTKKWGDWGRIVVLCEVANECKTVKNHFRSHAGILKGREIIGYF